MDGDHHARADSQRAQQVRQLVRLPVELAVGDGATGADGGHGGRRALDLRGEERVQGARGRGLPGRGAGGGRVGHRARGIRFGGGVPLAQQLMALRRRQQGEVQEAPPGIVSRPREQRLQVRQHAVDGGGVEKVRVITHRAAERLPIVDHGELQGIAHLGFADAHRLERETGHGWPLVAEVLEQQHHLEERVETERALGLQGLNQPLERQLLVSVGAQRGLPHLRQELGESQLARGPGAQHQHVDEQADQRLGLDPVAPRDRRADAHVSLAGVAVEQALEAGEQGHEQRRALGAGEAPQASR